MFLREIKSGKRTYLNIVETYYDKGKVKHRSIASLGRKDKLQDSEQLNRIAMSLLKYCNKNKTCFDIQTAEEKQRKIWGAPAVIRKIWDILRLDELFKNITKGYKIKFDFFSSVFLMVLDRLCKPVSKKKSYEEQDKYYGIKENHLQHLYRALDILADRKEDIEKNLFFSNMSLFNTKVDVIFYDVTTLYFESVRKDRLREFGFSKDQKINEVQIVLGLLIDQDTRPIGFDIFPGNTFEGRTIGVILEKLKKRFQINRLIFVGDQAMLSRENLQTITSLGYEYVVGSRIKNKTKEIKNKILDEEGYIQVKTKEEEGIFKYKEITTDNDLPVLCDSTQTGKIICAFSSRRKEKDKKDRERLIEKAKEILQKGGPVISKRGAMKYIKSKTITTKQIDEEKIQDDQMWDGYYGVETNCKFTEAYEVLNIYHELWKIEEAFRTLKSHIEARPMFHWTEERIKGHLVLCFIAFLLERTLELELKRNNIDYSSIKIREALNNLQFSEIEIEGQRFFLRSKVEGLANDILRILKIRIPPNITTQEGFKGIV